ncbi:hypothetical protein BDZ90DRAFT_74146 [Jaminaea rosea]|uniref:Uncharacterized protein n=1 Tax=Jaminaea rosea TaxID=1569628 RepID=A0A316UJ95_9BASI|nr:hypothetical protein BDZ90DRAFT_74146 [Jaminaea rosea]PWN25367.1 hypothetical protein BDZ90DRAFT_74146 [Jaminaea rosea]
MAMQKLLARAVPPTRRGRGRGGLLERFARYHIRGREGEEPQRRGRIYCRTAVAQWHAIRGLAEPSGANIGDAMVRSVEHCFQSAMAGLIMSVVIPRRGRPP